ncbi:transposase [Corynebacterium suedekumii]|nr:transposase [Corynebacterium suedekumii]
MPKNTYTDEFKADAVRLYEDTTGASFSMIATDLGISDIETGKRPLTELASAYEKFLESA